MESEAVACSRPTVAPLPVVVEASPCGGTAVAVGLRNAHGSDGLIVLRAAFGEGGACRNDDVKNWCGGKRAPGYAWNVDGVVLSIGWQERPSPMWSPK